jgi:hypothetical protein
LQPTSEVVLERSVFPRRIVHRAGRGVEGDQVRGELHELVATRLNPLDDPPLELVHTAG